MTNLEITVAQHGQQLEHSACRLKRIEEKLDRLYLWLIGVLGGSGARVRVTLTSSTNVAIHYTGGFLTMEGMPWVGEIPWEVVEFH